MKIYYKIDDFLDARSKLNSKKIILVPTMGSIHEGHISLINKARSYADIVIVTIFINPIQFNSSIDYDSYPRSIEEDKKTLEKNGVDILVLNHGMYQRSSAKELTLDELKLTFSNHCCC